MNQNTIKIKKISKTMLMFVRILMIAFVLFVVYMTKKGFSINYDNGLFREIMSLIVASIPVCVIIAILSVVSMLLKSVEKDYTPFNSCNVKKLKILSVLLMIFEPVQFISLKINDVIRPIVINGEKISVFTTLGGMIFTVGLVVFCVSLIFEYGIELQKQADETL
ncbi:DUF2975 domain-containing protein [Clostridium sp.]